MVVSIGRLGSGPATADYYLERQAGCESDYYTGAAQRRGRWLGDGARAVGLTGQLDAAGEDALRAMLDGTKHGVEILSPPSAYVMAGVLIDARAVWAGMTRGVSCQR